MCFINNYNVSPVELPFGGYKMSGELLSWWQQCWALVLSILHTSWQKGMEILAKLGLWTKRAAAFQRDVVLAKNPDVI